MKKIRYIKEKMEKLNSYMAYSNEENKVNSITEAYNRINSITEAFTYSNTKFVTYKDAFEKVPSSTEIELTYPPITYIPPSDCDCEICRNKVQKNPFKISQEMISNMQDQLAPIESSLTIGDLKKMRKNNTKSFPYVQKRFRGHKLTNVFK